MKQEGITKIVKAILIEHLATSHHQFNWDLPLQSLNEDFKILSYLVGLEQILSKEFQKRIYLLEHINTSFHTPKDILLLVKNQI